MIPKISKSVDIISLNYLDFDDEGNEETQRSEDIITSLPDTINNMINEKDKEQNFKQFTQSIITPDDSINKSSKSDEWKINETPKTVQTNDKNNNFSKESINEQHNIIDDPIEIPDSSLPIDKISKNGKIITNIKNQNVSNQIPEVNKKTKVINNNNNNNNNDQNISILNKIFQVDSKKNNKTHRNKITKKKQQVTSKRKQRQKPLSNINPIITIPSQDIPQNVTSNKQNKNQDDQITLTDGPAQRTRHFQNKRSSSIEYKTPVKIAKVSSKKISKESEKSSNNDKQDITDEPPVTHRSQNELQKGEDHILQESTTIVNTTPIPKQTLSINTSSLLDPQSFTNVLQAQINNSVAIFSNELTKKLTIINDEMNNTILKDLSNKYQGLIDELKVKFNNDTTNILHFVSDFQHLLLLPEDQLRTAIRDQFEASKNK